MLDSTVVADSLNVVNSWKNSLQPLGFLSVFVWTIAQPAAIQFIKWLKPFRSFFNEHNKLTGWIAAGSGLAIGAVLQFVPGQFQSYALALLKSGVEFLLGQPVLLMGGLSVGGVGTYSIAKNTLQKFNVIQPKASSND